MCEIYNNMRHILLFGAGRSASSLIKYILENAQKEQLHLTIADLSLDAALKMTANHPHASAVALNISNVSERQKWIEKTDIVISMLPAHLHMDVAKDCLQFNKNLVTASYISPAMQALDEQVKEKGLIFMNEIGLDPGIDHMSAMKVINEIRAKGGKMKLFESFCGGLVAPESDTNLWNYKFTWNPRNVVLAGQGGVSKFIQEGKYKYIPYSRLFRRTEFLEVEGYGRFEGYANRDSLKYRSIYGLDDIDTMYRGTLRRVGFSRAWDLLVQLGMTDDSYVMDGSEDMSYRDFTNAFLAYHPTDSVELKLRHYLKIDQDDLIWDKLLELDLFNADKKVGLESATPAQILEKILSEKWSLSKDDKDMIVMYHKFGFERDGQMHQIDSSMVCLGDEAPFTAMAKTVGLPVAMACIQILNGKISTTGVQLPVTPEVYEPILAELETFGIEFTEREVSYMGYNPNNVGG